MLVSEILLSITGQLKGVGLESPRLEAELLCSHSLKVERYKLQVSRDRKLNQDELKKIDRLVHRRLRFEPMAYILGSREFYSLDFKVNRHVMIPRPETELLVDLVLYYAPFNGSVLDLGTGSGAIAVSVKHNRGDCDVFASDISRPALGVARKNARRLLGANSVRFSEGDLFAPFLGECFDVIVANPPYIDRDVSETLQRDLQYEPDIALFAENNGKDVIERIIAESGDHLHESGVLIIEIGYDMKYFVQGKGKSCGFSVSVLNDYAGLPRVAVLKKRIN